ncbi:hypothetical protein [Bradyrhizobium cosmicum]|uniref:hypothetical protein n=1 Tax=Bradyrhizobium cosmicum TaxID=1404864 RepID=UPI0028EB3695|nr:hypothetical protein [Bradyrhizobium cosmicum]
MMAAQEMSASNDRMKTPGAKKKELPVPEWAQMVKDDEPSRQRGCALRKYSGISAALLTRGGLIAHMSPDERSPRHLRHLPRDYELAIRWLEPSFLKNH